MKSIFKKIHSKYIELSFFKFICFIVRKSFKLMMNFLIRFLILPMNLILYLIYPFVKVRFGMIHNDVFGHYLFDPEFYLRKKKLTKEKSYDLFFFSSNHEINTFWDKVIKRNFKVNSIFKFFFLNSNLFFRSKNSFKLNERTARDTENIFYRTNIQLSFTKEEINDGKIFLKSIGLKQNQKFVCVVNRDPFYKKNVVDQYYKDRNWDYHNYRNSNIDTYIPAIEYLLKKNYFVIRVGKGVSKKLEIDHENFLDYSSSELRNDFLDVFLMSNSYFNLVSESGLLIVSLIYNVPICFVNMGSIKATQVWHEKQITIFKKIWSNEKKNFLSLKEHKYLSDPNNYKDKTLIRNENSVYFWEDNEKYSIHDNTPQEILDATIETENIVLNNTWKNRNKSKLETDFWKNFLYDKNFHGPQIRSSVGNQFLEDNKYLLD